MHDPLEDWAEKDRLLAEIGVEPVAREPEPPPSFAPPEDGAPAGQAPPPPPPPPALSPLGPARVVRRAAPLPVESLPPPPVRVRPPVARRHAVASVAVLAVGVVWLAAGAGAGSMLACLVGLGFLSLGATAALLLNKA